MPMYFNLITFNFRFARYFALGLLLTFAGVSQAADHNDPNAVNSIFSNIPINAADLYGMFGYPNTDASQQQNVIVQLTFASIPQAGVFDTDMLYKINFRPAVRASATLQDKTLEGIISYTDALKSKYFNKSATEIRVTFNKDNRAKVDFIGFASGDFSKVVDTNQNLIIETPDGHEIKTFIGGRDDPFFNDLPGFFRSINYGPQFYNIPTTAPDEYRELEIPKTLLELEDNTLFNFDPARPNHGKGEKFDFPADGKLTWEGKKFKQDATGNYQFVYSGKDAQTGMNVNAVIFEVPHAFISQQPKKERIVNIWGESWALRADSKIDTKGSETLWNRFVSWLMRLFSSSSDTDGFNSNTHFYKRIDTVGVPFLDAALSERYDSRQVGANNLLHARAFVKRLGHLGWGFGPSVTALGLGACFDHDNSPVSVYKKYKLATAAFTRAKKCSFQALNMPDDSWKNAGVDVPLKRSFEIFVPNVTAIDMDTTGTWPYGRRPEDQVASRFLAIFLDMESPTGCGNAPCNIESLGNQALWNAAPVVNKNVPNPLLNDKPFLNEFPYLAAPW